MAGIGRGRKAPVIKTEDNVPGVFGNEQLDPILSKLSPNQIATLYKYPEQAMADHLMYLIFFNKDATINHTIRAANGEIMVHTSKGWKAVNNVLDILKVVAGHYRKVMEYTKARADNLVSSVDHMKANEYLRAIAIGGDIHVSVNCPIYPFIDDGVISIERMVTSVTHIVNNACMWSKDEWPSTVMFAKNNIFDDDTDY